MNDIAVYMNTPDCSCGHPQNIHYYPGSAPIGCTQCTTCKEYDGVIETLGVGRDPNHLYPAVYEDGCLILPPELLVDTSLDDAEEALNQGAVEAALRKVIYYLRNIKGDNT